MKDNYDFSKGRKNPFAKKIREEGYSILIHYAPGQTHCEEEDAGEHDIFPQKATEFPGEHAK